MIDGFQDRDLILDTMDGEIIYIVKQCNHKSNVIVFTRAVARVHEYFLVAANYGNRLILLDRQHE